VVIDWRDGRLSIHAHAAPWEDVLPALVRHTGVPIRVHGPLAGTLTQAFAALPLEQGLQRLFRNVNTVFFYAAAPETGGAAAPLTQVWLVPRDPGAAAQPPSPGGGLAPAPREASAPRHGDRAKGPRPEEVPPDEAEETAEEEAGIPRPEEVPPDEVDEASGQEAGAEGR
jgi:hypothetical protein